MFFHFGDGVGAAHEGALCGHVELSFGEELAGRLTRAHLTRIEQAVEEVKEVVGKVKGTTDERR
jgi:hypothetical protein